MRVFIFVFFCYFVYSIECVTYAQPKTTSLNAAQAEVACIRPVSGSRSLFRCTAAPNMPPFPTRAEALVGCTNQHVEQAGLYDCLQMVPN